MANEYRFYHLTQTSLENALPQLLQRTLDKGWRAVVVTDSDERVEHLNQHLWTYDPGSFLAHGTKKDGDAPHHPIWLCTDEVYENDANVLFLMDGMVAKNPNSFELICIIFDGLDPLSVQSARTYWKELKSTNSCKLTYWQQTESGWELKNSDG